MCGEHSTSNSPPDVVSGSSPHVRGALGFRGDGTIHRGIIPACAGSTCPQRRHNASVGDHPRMCGEHVRHVFHEVVGQGSSPHVRGARFRVSEHVGQRGIIPACAGSTVMLLYICSRQRDHPRMCGEHWSLTDAVLFLSGSSPHVRGAL